MMPLASYGESNCWLSALLIKKGVNKSPLDLMTYLKEHDIESRPIWKPMHMQPIYRNNAFITCHGNGRARTNAYIEGSGIDVGADIFARGLCLPSDNKMSEEEQKVIIEIVKKIFDLEA